MRFLACPSTFPRRARRGRKSKSRGIGGGEEKSRKSRAEQRRRPRYRYRSSGIVFWCPPKAGYEEDASQKSRRSGTFASFLRSTRRSQLPRPLSSNRLHSLTGTTWELSEWSLSRSHPSQTVLRRPTPHDEDEHDPINMVTHFPSPSPPARQNSLITLLRAIRNTLSGSENAVAQSASAVIDQDKSAFGFLGAPLPQLDTTPKEGT